MHCLFPVSPPACTPLNLYLLAVLCPAMPCRAVPQVIAQKHQAISSLFKEVQVSQASLDDRLQQLALEVQRVRASRRTSRQSLSTEQ
jgi:hypothetical protein